MSTETQIEITNLADVRAGDTVTMSYDGHEFSGVVWAREEDPDRLLLGPRGIRWADDPIGVGLEFVRAVRTPKLDPPTVPGTIRATYATGDRFPNRGLVTWGDDE